jgi:hypothetical protein
LNPRHNYGQGDYFLLYNTLSNCDWSCVLNENSVDSAVYNLTAGVSETINEAITSVKPKSSTFPHWFSISLIYYIKKKNRSFNKYKSDYYYSIFMRSLHDVHEMNAGLVMSVCLSIRMIQLESSWTNLDEMWYGCYAIGDYPKIVLYNFLQLVIPTWQVNKLVR